MMATRHVRLDGGLCLTDAPEGWSQEVYAADPRAVLALVGPVTAGGLRPRVVARFLRGGRDLDDLVDAGWRDFQEAHPHALKTNQEPWHHPVWGDGVLVQTARLESDGALAYDCFVFPHGERFVLIELTCALVDLLPLEEQVAAIVAAVRPEET